MNPIFYDTHAHLDFPEYREDLEGVIARAKAAGIERIISIGTDLESSKRAIAIAERFPEVYAVVGWHPGDALAAPDDVRGPLEKLARHPKVVAIGETGLDYYRLPGAKEGGTAADDEKFKRKQAEIFKQQMEVAMELGLNCVIHNRVALEDTLEQMEPFRGKVRGVFHCFVDGPEEMRRILASGSIVSFTGILTFKNAPMVRETLKAVPAGSFMLETDAPFLAPVPYRGKRCESAYVKEIAEFAAQERNCSVEELSRITCETARAFFPKLG